MSRPGPAGPAVRQVVVWTNYLAMTTPFPTKQMFQYDVVFSPEVKGRVIERHREIFDRLQTKVAAHVFTGGRASFDGRAILISSYELPLGGLSLTIPVNMSNRVDPANPNRGVYRVTLTLVKTLQPQRLIEYCNPTGDRNIVNLPDALDMLNAMNIIFRQAPMQKLPHTAKSYYLPNQQKEISGDILLYMGLFQSIRPALNRTLINVNLTAGKFWAPRQVMSVIMDHLESRDARRLVNMNPRDLRAVTKYLKGVRIISKHKTDPAPPRPIQAIIREGADTYELEDTGETIQNYFWRVYHIKLNFPSACCVQITSRIVFPLETCFIVPDQFYKHELPAKFRDTMLNLTSPRPEERLKLIMDNIRELDYETSDYVRNAGLGVTMQPLKLTAPVIPCPQILYAGNKTARIENGSWNTRDDYGFWRGARLRAWVMICTVTERQYSAQNATRFRDQLVECMRRRGIQINAETPQVHYVNGQVLLRELQRIHTEAVARYGGLDLMVVITDRSPDLYYTLKHFGDVMVGVATQHLDFKKVSRANDQMCANIAMKFDQINPKLGGVNHVPSPKSAGWLQQAPTIIFGADTSHPGPSEQEKPTIASLVSSVDETGSKYRAIVRIQPGRVEIIQELSMMVQSALKAFQSYQEVFEKRKGVIPQRVLFYRDGVGEGQFHEVCEQELTAVRAAFAALGMPQPKITFVIVGKRHHTRFFPFDKRDGDKSGNAPSGLVVASDIVHPAYINWFLLSQGGLKGTSRPMHACVMADENRFPVQALQSLTYTLTHNFARATRAVSIPAPIYYAHIASGRRAIHFKSMQEGSVISSGELTYADYERAFQKINPKLENVPYFM